MTTSYYSAYSTLFAYPAYLIDYYSKYNVDYNRILKEVSEILIDCFISKKYKLFLDKIVTEDLSFDNYLKLAFLIMDINNPELDFKNKWAGPIENMCKILMVFE